ncbi:hypothetical protein GON01_00205 [Sphingomonas sp. MAH-20]|jgi:hypothetical protein|uniref:Terminase n=1 Tax=Sphingomonas horti TaxID=2682842 RepID=A0A6I4IWB8_9SPHN|nr:MULTISPECIES: hypothetical protein [Sphingomonas]MBA2920109.1 hypothetical protein [Sphingomonas sp. CGMCC 1.13658]MVO76364.1 hypothetical protein [Sphingomonas horti]
MPKAPKPVGERIVIGKSGHPQSVSSGRYFWSDKAEQVFLDHLAATCNVQASADAAGFSNVAVYRRRRKWPGFAERWDAALAQGYARLEAVMLANAADTMEGLPPDPDMPIPPMSVADALNLLRLHRAAVKGGSPQTYRHRKMKSLDDVRASIVRKLEAIERAGAKS